MVNADDDESTALDLRGLKCPLPALKARKALQVMQPGLVLSVLATDPMSAIDIPNMVRETGDVLLGQSSSDGVLSFSIKKM